MPWTRESTGEGEMTIRVNSRAVCGVADNDLTRPRDVTLSSISGIVVSEFRSSLGNLFWPNGNFYPYGYYNGAYIYATEYDPLTERVFIQRYTNSRLAPGVTRWVIWLDMVPPIAIVSADDAASPDLATWVDGPSFTAGTVTASSSFAAGGDQHESGIIAAYPFQDAWGWTLRGRTPDRGTACDGTLYDMKRPNSLNITSAGVAGYMGTYRPTATDRYVYRRDDDHWLLVNKLMSMGFGGNTYGTYLSPTSTPVTDGQEPVATQDDGSTFHATPEGEWADGYTVTASGAMPTLTVVGAAAGWNGTYTLDASDEGTNYPVYKLNATHWLAMIDRPALLEGSRWALCDNALTVQTWSTGVRNPTDNVWPGGITVTASGPYPDMVVTGGDVAAWRGTYTYYGTKSSRPAWRLDSTHYLVGYGVRYALAATAWEPYAIWGTYETPTPTDTVTENVTLAVGDPTPGPWLYDETAELHYLQFDGSGIVEVPVTDVWETVPCSVVAYVRATELGSDAGVRILYNCGDELSGDRFIITVSDTGVLSAYTVGSSYIHDEATVTEDTWTQLVVTTNGRSLSVYQDGELLGALANGAVFRVGSVNSLTVQIGENWVGDIANLAVLGSCLTAAEVTRLYAEPWLLMEYADALQVLVPGTLPAEPHKYAPPPP